MKIVFFSLNGARVRHLGGTPKSTIPGITSLPEKAHIDPFPHLLSFHLLSAPVCVQTSLLLRDSRVRRTRNQEHDRKSTTTLRYGNLVPKGRIESLHGVDFMVSNTCNTCMFWGNTCMCITCMDNTCIQHVHVLGNENRLFFSSRTVAWAPKVLKGLEQACSHVGCSRTITVFRHIPLLEN